MIDWVDAACKSWGDCTRWMLDVSTNPKRHIDGYPTRDTIEKARDGLLNVRASGLATQQFGEVRAGSALEVARAMRGAPDATPSVLPMPYPLTVTMHAQYVARMPNPVKRAAIVSEFLRAEIGVRGYWNYVHDCHVWLSARLPG